MSGNYPTNYLNPKQYMDRIVNPGVFAEELNSLAQEKLRSERPDYDITKGNGKGGGLEDYSNFPFKPYRR